MDQSSGDLDREVEESVSSRPLTPATIGRFLIGDREAIRQVANCPNAMRLGLVFVLSAGLAREYDGAALLYEPWHALAPLAASLITSYVLFLMVSLVAFRRGADIIRTRGAYRREFLGLFWMTAPMAWLYAIPVERFLSPGDATAANLTLLGIVALWRVVLMIRVVTVAFGAKTVLDVVSTVMLFADMVMLVALYAMPTPIWAVMGGIHLTDSEQHILGVTLCSTFWGIVSLPFWLIGFLLTCRKTPAWNPIFGKGFATIEVARSSWGLAIASLLIWAPMLPFTQSEQSLRFQADRDLAAGRIDDALRLMSNHDRADFPPHWDPPPHPGYGVQTPNLYLVMDSIATGNDYRPWVRELYVDKFMSNLNLRYLRSDGEGSELERVVELLERIPDARRVFAEDHRGDAWRLTEDSDLPPSLQGRIRVLAGISELPASQQDPPASSVP